MIALTDVRVFTVRCFYCNGGEFDHDRVTAACHVYARAEVRPYRLAVRKVPAAAGGWVVRPA